MNQFIAFVKKEFFHILRDRRTLFILFGMPIAQILLFGYAVTNEFKDASIAIFDQSKDELSLDLVQQLQASGHFKVAASVNKKEEVEALMKASTIKMAVIIPDDFSEKFHKEKNAPIQLIADGADPNSAVLLTNYASIIINQFQSKLSEGKALPIQVQAHTQLVYNPDLKSVYMFVPGVLTMILLLVSAMLTALTIAKEKELGTMSLLLASPLPPLMIIIGKVVPYILLSIINMVVIMLMGVFIFGVPVLGSLILLSLLSLLFILTSLSLGIFISTKTKDQQSAMLSSLMLLMMPTMILSGFIFPIESMPRLLQVISYVIPAKYFIVILKAIMLKGSGLAIIWKEAAMLGGMTLVFLVLSLKNFKIRLD